MAEMGFVGRRRASPISMRRSAASPAAPCQLVAVAHACFPGSDFTSICRVVEEGANVEVRG